MVPWSPVKPVELGPSETAGDTHRELTEALAKVGWSEALAAKLREEEAILGRLKTERTAAGRRPAAPVVPHPGAIAGYLKNLFALLDTDPVRGREVLSRFVSPVVMTPENAEGPERRYRATGAFNLSFLLTAAAEGETRSGKFSCAGAIPRVGNGDFGAD